MGTDSDSTDEENSVLQTLTELETSTSELVQSVLSQVQTEFASWNVTYCRQVLTSLTPSSSWRSCLHPDLRSPGLASMTGNFNSLLDVRSIVSEANSPPPLFSLTQEVYSPDGTVIETSSVKLEVIRVSSMEPHPPYESSSPLHHNVFKGDDSDNMDFIPYADDHTFDQASHTHHYGSFSWQDTFDPDCEHPTRPIIVRHNNI